APTEQTLAFSKGRNDQIIWLSQSGRDGGGGGGGNRVPDPPRQAKLPGKDLLTVPVAPAVVVDPRVQPKAEPDPVAQLDIPALSLASATDSLVGVLDAPTSELGPSQGPGRDNGAGDGTGPGIGSGDGSGFGPGSGGNRGGRQRGPASGTTSPR